jgi:ubiquinone biosynthesis protein
MTQTPTTTAPAADAPELSAIPRLKRAGTILRVAVDYGWGGLVDRLGLRPVVAAGAATEAAETDGAARLRLALEALGPTFVKLGQLLSVQRDLLPPDQVRELEKLQEKVAPFPAVEATRIIEAELGQPLSNFFARFDETPMAAASIAQVHHAVLKDGTAVVVKVQRPGIEDVIKADLDIMFFIARLLEKHVPESRLYNPVGVVEELAENILRELDFLREADSAERFLDRLKNDPAVYVPRIVWPASSRRVLTMEHSPGRRIDGAHPPDHRQRRQIADSLMRLLLAQIFENGFFHGDPHPGNIFVLDDGRLCFHDFGIIGRLSPRDQENLRQLFLAVIARDPEWLAETYLDMGGATGPIDRAAFTRDFGRALEHYYATYGQGNSFGEMLSQFIRLGGKHNVRLIRQILLAAKAFMLTESLIRSLDPAFDTIAAFQAYSQRLLKNQLLPDLSHAGFARGYRGLSALKWALGELPVALAKGLRLLQQGELVVRVRHEQLDTLQQHLDRASNRLSFSLLIAAIVVSSSIVMSFHTGPHVEDIPLIGLVGYGIAAVLGLWWAVAMLRSGRL